MIDPRSLTFGGDAVVPLADDMARRRYQRPNVQRKEVSRPYWFIRYRADVLTETGIEYREQPPKFLGYCDELSKKEAGKLRDEFLRTVNATPVVLQSQVRLGAFLKTYRELHVSGLKPNTRRSTESILKNHIEPEWGGKRLCDIKTEGVQIWARKLQQSLGPGTVRNVVKRLEHIFEEASRLDYYQQRNPVSKVKLGEYSPEREVITVGQYQMLLSVLPEDMRLMVRLAAECGLRIGEIQGLRWRHIRGEVVMVREQMDAHKQSRNWVKTKSSKREVPMGHLTTAVRAWRKPEAKDDDFIFAPQCYEYERNRLVEHAKLAGITADRFGYHTLRHLYGTVLRQAGATDLDHDRALGHANRSMAAVYSQGDESGRREQLARQAQELLMGESNGGVN